MYPSRRSSSTAAASWVMSRSWKPIPFCERYSFVRWQNIQPGCVNSVTVFFIVDPPLLSWPSLLQQLCHARVSAGPKALAGSFEVAGIGLDAQALDQAIHEVEEGTNRDGIV